MAADYDSPWKEALDAYFEPFLALLFPTTHAEIDWSRGHESLDKEFQAIVREAEIGRRHVDKLAKVWTLDGAERWVLIHVEVQTSRDADFPERMYVYNYRIFDRYNQAVASLAVLADDDPHWRPSEFRQALFGCETGIRFPAVKLLDFASKEVELEASENPFSKVVLAHLKAMETRKDVVNRYVWKVRLIRGLYERGLGAKEVRELFRLIDWLMALPVESSKQFWTDLEKIQKEDKMPYVSTPERVLMWRAWWKSIEGVLRIRFGNEGLALMPAVEKIYKEERLIALHDALIVAESLEDVRPLFAPTDPNWMPDE